jgi:hypothetical protein
MRTKTLAALACLGLLCALSGNALAAAAPKAPAKQGKAAAAEALTADPAETVRQLLAAFGTDKAGVEIERIGLALGISADKAAAVLDALARDSSPDAAMLRAELLVQIARGDETPQWQRKDRTVRPETMPTADLCRRAGELLDHPDPFVRGLAEFAIAIRLGLECEGRSDPAWARHEGAEWYRRWSAVGADAMLQCDYVRQGAGLGCHRTAKALASSADAAVGRAVKMAAWARPRMTPDATAALDRDVAALQQARQALADLASAKPADLTAQRVRWLAVRLAARNVVLRNPDLAFSQILFATRSGADSGNITNGGLRDVYGPGGDIHIKAGFNPADPARPLIAGRLGAGHIRGLDLWWDADRIVFSYVRQPQFDGSISASAENSEAGRSETAHLYEIILNGGGMRQFTNARFNSDVEPCYLPNGDIIFVSDRSNYGSQCAGGLIQDKMILNLYRCSPSGANIRALSNNKDFDRYPHMLDNGQILFLHWEYQERHLWQTHTLWTCRPDGSMTDAVYKQHIESGPMSLREARQVPGQQQLVAIACGHHNGEIGAVMLVDYALGINEPLGMRLVTPRVSATEGGYGKCKPVEDGGVEDAGGHYQFPYPLSDRAFLVAYSYKKPESASARNYGLYYIDVWGNKELIHRDRRLSVAYLMPLRRTPRPPALPDTHVPAVVAASPQRFATAYLANVNHDMPGVKAGVIRYIRISQKMPWPCVREETRPCGYNDLHSSPSGAWTPMFGIWDWSPARVIGTVPVEADGSAWFKVPADQPVYFQALDENYLEVRRMRSNVTFQHGEYRGCIGCHESRAIAPPTTEAGHPLALRREPSVPAPPAWGDRAPPAFERDIQPILDRHCVRCHGEKDPKGGLELTARRMGDHFQSYRTLFGVGPAEPTPVAGEDGWRWMHPKDPMPPANPDFFKRAMRNEQPGQLIHIANRLGGAEITAPLAFGSARSPLLVRLLNDAAPCKEIRRNREDWVSLVTWVDLNAPYFDTYTNKNRAAERQPVQWVSVTFPDPWQMPPAGEWIWKDPTTVVLRP